MGTSEILGDLTWDDPSGFLVHKTLKSAVS